MKRNLIRRWGCCSILFIAACFTAMTTQGEDTLQSVQRRQGDADRQRAAQQAAPESRSDPARQFLRRAGWLRSPSIYQRSHETVMAAFRDVVSGPAKYTVRVLSGGEAVALGAIVDSNGFILSKASELKGEVACEMSDGQRLPAKIVGVHQQTDLAMLKIESSQLPAIAWSDHGAPLVGSWLVTPGLNSDPTSIGVVSVAPRRIAAPSGVLGVMLEQDTRGARIAQVLPSSGAEKAGLLPSDVISAVNGSAVASREDLIQFVQRFQPGDTVRLSLWRGESKLDILATLGSRSLVFGEDRQEFQNSLGGPLSERRDGFPSVLQHDTVLRPEQCGGPVLDLDGKAVGINIARADRVSSYAIPASVVKPLLADLKSGRLAPTGLTGEPPHEFVQTSN